MIGLVLAIVGIIVVIMLIFPIRFVLKVVELSIKAELAIIERNAETWIDDQEIRSRELVATGYTKQANNEERLLSLKIQALRLQAKAKLSTIHVIQWFVKILYHFILTITGVNVIILGVGVAVALTMATQIPSWMILFEQQGNTTSSKTSNTSSKTDTNESSSADATGALPNNAPNETVAAYILMLGKGVPSNGAIGICGSLMVETGGADNSSGTHFAYKLHTEYDNQHNSGGLTVGGFGIIQWNGVRADKIRARKDAKTIEGQISFMMEELKESYPAVNSVIMNKSTSIDTAADTFRHQYEVGLGDAKVAAHQFDKEWVQNGKYKQYMKSK